MLIYPAIDLYQGKAVRLYKGDYSQMTVYSHDPAAIARTPGCTPAIMRQVIDKLLASGPDTTVYIYDPRGEGAAMGLTDGCKVIEDAAFFRKNSDVILAPAAAREELAEVAGKVYCREFEL